MKPTGFIITIPTKGWSKHDDPAESKRIFEEEIQGFLTRWKNYAGGVLPFDIEKVRVEVVSEG
jgi:hypothetical protein